MTHLSLVEFRSMVCGSSFVFVADANPSAEDKPDLEGLRWLATWDKYINIHILRPSLLL